MARAILSLDFATMAVLLDILGTCATKLAMSDILECIVLRAVLLIVFMVYVVIMTEHVLVNQDGVDLLTET